jgi:DNA-binding transcriptional ArsR family regulator
MLKNSCKCLKERHYEIFFLNLANPLKMKIILLLRNKEMNVSKIVKELKTDQSKVSHALKSLKECKLVLFKKSGKERIYYLNKKTIIPILGIIENHVLCYCKDKCLKLNNQSKIIKNRY